MINVFQLIGNHVKFIDVTSYESLFLHLKIVEFLTQFNLLQTCILSNVAHMLFETFLHFLNVLHFLKCEKKINNI